MYSTRLFRAWVLLSLLSLGLLMTGLAQTPALTKAEAQAARKQQALKLLDECLTEIPSLRLPDNRIALQTRAVALLWPQDAARARALAQQTLAQLLDLYQQLPPPGEQAYYQQANFLMNLSRPLFDVLAKHEPKLALELMQAIRNLRPASESDRQPFEEELQLLARLAAEDPQLAYQRALESLKEGISYSHLTLWQTLRNKDPKLAQQFLEEMVSQFQKADWQTQNNAIIVVAQVLQILNSELTNAERVKAPSATKNAAQASENLEALRLQLRQLLEVVINAALKVNTDDLFNQRTGDAARFILMQLQQQVPLIEKQLPARLPAVRAKLAQLGQPLRGNGFNPYEVYQPDEKSAMELTALAAKASAQDRNWLYEQAVAKLAAQGEFDQARQLINDKLTDPMQRREALNNLDRQKLSQAAQAGKYAEAQALLTRLPPNEQFYARLNLAQQALQKENKKIALQMLAELRAWVSERAVTRNQVEQQTALANVYAKLEVERSFELLEGVVTRLNVILAAYAVTLPFDENEMYKEGEWRLLFGQIHGVPNSFSEVLLQLGQENFERTDRLIKQWESPEVRLLQQFALVQTGLADESAAKTRLSTGNE